MRSLRRKILTGSAIVILAASAFGQGSGGTWQTLQSMPSFRQELATAVLDGKIYVLGGYDENGNSTTTVEVYNPGTDSWATAAPLPMANNHNAAAVAAGRLYSFGGVTPSTYLYDSGNNSWSAVAGMAQQHAGTAAAGVIDDKIYVAGGKHANATIRTLERYDPATNTWTTLAPMNVSRNHCAGAVIAGQFYVVGGRGGDGAATALEVYNPQTNQWTSRAPMPTGRSGLAAAAVGGELWVFGGEIPGIRGEVEVYNPATNTWRRLAPMPTPRHGIWAAVIGRRIYLIGGGINENLAAVETNEVLIVDQKTTFGNIASRARVERGDDVVIGGFIVRGTTSKRVLLRGMGPSVPVTGALANPTLELYDGAGTLVATNDNWNDASNRLQIADSGLAPAPLEAAILTRVAPGQHTVVLRGAGDTTGIGLIEIYDLEAGSESRLANISTRARVQTGDNVLIGGIIVTGTTPSRVLVRATGPSLPLSGVLGDPTLELFNANGVLLDANNDWRSRQEAEIVATEIAPAHDREAAILATLGPGNYTGIVRGLGETSGIGLVEAFEVE